MSQLSFLFSQIVHNFSYTLLPLLLISLPIILLYKFGLCKREGRPAVHQPLQAQNGPRGTLITRKFRRIIRHKAKRPRLSISCNGLLFDLYLNPIPEGFALLQKILELKHYEVFLIIRVGLLIEQVSKETEEEKVLNELQAVTSESRESYFEEARVLNSVREDYQFHRE